MTFTLRRLVLIAFVATLAFPVHAAAQDPPPPPPSVTALMVEVTVNRYQGDKRLSSIPYTVAVLPDDVGVRLRVGGEIPVQIASSPTGKEPEMIRPPGISYRPIGTNIDVSARPAGPGRFRLAISLEETSVYSDETRALSKAPSVASSGMPAFRNLRTSNNMVLKDGQSIEFTAASDRISGEVARIAVKLTVVP